MAKHLTVEERDRIAQLRHRGADQQEIAQAVGRCPSTISRELRRQERPLLRKMEDPEINEAVRAGCPYQRGTSENTNGLIRPYFPKGTDFRDISHDEVRQVEKLLNNRPRACLGFRTPAEVFFEKTPPTGCD